MPKDKNRSWSQKRTSKLLRLSRSLDKVTVPSFKNRGFAEHRIITDWQYIVGESIARYSNPRKLVFPANSKQGGVLHIEVYDSAFATEIHYLGPLMKERIATYFGYRAVDNFRLIQKPLPIEREEEELLRVPLTAEDKAMLKTQLEGVNDKVVLESLERLAKVRLLKQKKEKES